MGYKRIIVQWQHIIERLSTQWAQNGKWVFPDSPKSLGFIVTEVGEAFDAYLRTEGNDGFVRNNPGVPEESWVQELADIVFQCYVTAIVAGVDLDQLLDEKLERMDEKRR